jgi:hypothetical protein
MSAEIADIRVPSGAAAAEQYVAGTSVRHAIRDNDYTGVVSPGKHVCSGGGALLAPAMASRLYMCGVYTLSAGIAELLPHPDSLAILAALLARATACIRGHVADHRVQAWLQPPARRR